MQTYYESISTVCLITAIVLFAGDATGQACCYQFGATEWRCQIDQFDTCGFAVGDVFLGEGTSCTTPDSQQFTTADACVAANSGSLPVELVRLEALVHGNEATLHWSTASETNNSGFAVETEVAAGEFANVGFVDGHGTTDEANEYAFRISGLAPGLHRFRLKQVDFDGTFEYSPVVEAAVTVPDQFLIEPAHPNPFNPSTTLRFAVASDQSVTVRLINSAGQVVGTLFEGTVAANDMQILRIDAETLPSGTYLVHFQVAAGFESTEQIVLTK